MLSIGLLIVGSSICHAVIIRLDNTGSPGLGDNLDGIGVGVTPTNVDVPEIPGLSITIHSIGPDGGLNSTAISLGINGDSDLDTDAFESMSAQRATFSFNQSVSFTQLDFTNFESGEEFNFAGQVITNSDLANGTTDIFNFATPLVITADTQFSLEAISGTIGIEAFDLTVVPEPTVTTFCSFVVLLSLLYRQR